MLILKYATKLNITTIAMINSGGMRAKSLGNDITMEDLLNVFPYENSIDVMELKGGTIRKVLEKSAKLLSPEKPNTGGGFIQVSGKLKNVKSNLDKSTSQKAFLDLHLNVLQLQTSKLKVLCGTELHLLMYVTFKGNLTFVFAKIISQFGFLTID